MGQATSSREGTLPRRRTTTGFVLVSLGTGILASRLQNGKLSMTDINTACVATCAGPDAGRSAADPRHGNLPGLTGGQRALSVRPRPPWRTLLPAPSW